tara:strand:+ start:503 stop:892 length:390 start_codon:yes stop_codon:yes gene_type:complete
MAYKDITEYGFGQMGSIHAAGTEAVTIIGGDDTDGTPASNVNKITKVFVAITFLEDTVFANTLAGLTPQIPQLYFGGGPGDGTDSKSTDIDADGGDVTGTEVFPRGVTIYGRWTGFQLASGRVIAYVGI